MGPAAGRKSRLLLDGAGGHRALHADGRSRRRGDQDRGAGGRRRLAQHDRAARHAQHLLRDQQSRREERDAQSQVSRRPRHPAQARRQGRHLRPELPPRCGRKERLRLGGAAQDQSQIGLCLDLGLRHTGAERPSAGHQFDGAGAGRHRRGLFHTGPEDAHGIASVANESTAMLAFGGALAALAHARTTGVGQKVKASRCWARWSA